MKNIFVFIGISANFFLINALGAENASTHICYFSLNNEKEFIEMEKFTSKLNKFSPRKITVSEYLTEGGNPEENFEKMIQSGVRCNGLVISGHHTGSYGGKRGNGVLGISFIEKLSCNPKYQDWFKNVQALWLQGCRTLGVKIARDSQTSADDNMLRVGAALEEDNLPQNYSNLNMEFSATLDQDNPLSSRYLRIFSNASVFGWTKSAPGKKVRSELSIPYHIAHITAIKGKDETGTRKFLEDPSQKISLETAVKYTHSLLGLLEKNNYSVDSPCRMEEGIPVEGWYSHGQARGVIPLSFNNRDLEAFPSLASTQDQILGRAKHLDCILKGSGQESILNALDEVLKNEDLIRYNFNSIWSMVQSLVKEKSNLKLLDKIILKLNNSTLLSNFLLNKFSSTQVGILNKIDYYSFYKQVFNQSLPSTEQAINNSYIKFATIFLDKKTPLTLDEKNFFITLHQSIAKNKILTGETQKKVEDHFLKNFILSKDKNPLYLSSFYDIFTGTKNDLLVKEITSLLDNKSSEVQLTAINALAIMGPSDQDFVQDALLKSLNAPDAEIKSAAISALAIFKKNNAKIKIKLKSIISNRDEDEDVRIEAINYFRNRRTLDADIQAGLVQNLELMDEDIQLSVLDLLVQYQPKINLSPNTLEKVKKLLDPKHGTDVNDTAKLLLHPQ